MSIRRKKVPTSGATSPAPPASPPYKGLVQASHLLRLSPLTPAQHTFVDAYDTGVPCIALHGMAGTGKTFMAIYKALSDVLRVAPTQPPRRLIIVRSAVPTRDLGFLPGGEAEKMAVYTAPYQDICARLVQHPDGFAKLSAQGRVEFWSTSYLRGLTIDHAVVVVDECQNMTDMELHSLMTRLGPNSRIIWCGDIHQTDAMKSGTGATGLHEFLDLLSTMPNGRVRRIEFGIDDIVRSALVKEYLIARHHWQQRPLPKYKKNDRG